MGLFCISDWREDKIKIVISTVDSTDILTGRSESAGSIVVQPERTPQLSKKDVPSKTSADVARIFLKKAICIQSSTWVVVTWKSRVSNYRLYYRGCFSQKSIWLDSCSKNALTVSL